MSKVRRRAPSVAYGAIHGAFGYPLFVGPPLETELPLAGQMARDKAIRAALASGCRLTKLHLRRVATAAATHAEAIQLGKPKPGGTFVRAGWDHMACVVPFTGDGALFRFSLKGYPPPRALHAQVCNNELVLSIRFSPENERMVGPLLASELHAISDQIAAQGEVSNIYNRGLPHMIGGYIEAQYEALIASRERITAEERERERLEQHQSIMELVVALGGTPDMAGMLKALGSFGT